MTLASAPRLQADFHVANAFAIVNDRFDIGGLCKKMLCGQQVAHVQCKKCCVDSRWHTYENLCGQQVA